MLVVVVLTAVASVEGQGAVKTWTPPPEMGNLLVNLCPANKKAECEEKNARIREKLEKTYLDNLNRWIERMDEVQKGQWRQAFPKQATEYNQLSAKFP